MRHLFSGRWTIVLFVLFFLLAASVFKSAAEDATPTASPSIGTDPAEGESPTIKMVFGPGSFNLTMPTVGLSDLSSYRATLTVSFKGTQAGQPAVWSHSYVMLASQNPLTRQLTIDKVGGSAAQVFMVEVNGTHYERQGASACAASVIEKDTSLAEKWEPAGFLDGVIGAEEAGSETVNGVATKHYTFDERALAQISDAKSTGELWVASDGMYIIRYMLATTGGADYFGEGIEGTISWDYELTDIGQPFTVTLPTDCPPGIVDAPLLPDATDVLSVPGLLSYSSTTSLSDVVAFYQKQLPTLGWQTADAPPATDAGVLLDFTRGGQQMSVIIGVDGANTNVNILVASAPKGPVVPTTPPTRTPIPTKTKVPTRTPIPTKTKVPTRTPIPTKTKVPTRTPAH